MLRHDITFIVQDCSLENWPQLQPVPVSAVQFVVAIAVAVVAAAVAAVVTAVVALAVAVAAAVGACLCA